MSERGDKGQRNYHIYKVKLEKSLGINKKSILHDVIYRKILERIF